MKKQLRSFAPVILVASSLCAVAEGYETAQPGDKVVGPEGTLELVERGVLISNNGDNAADQLHFAWLYESANKSWYMTYREGAHGAPDGDRVQVVQSRDRGQTWIPFGGLTAEPWLYQFFPIRLPDGSLIFYRCKLTGLERTPDGTTKGISYMYRSTNEGATWTRYEAPVTGMPYSTDASLKTLWGPGIQMPDGRLLIGITSREGGSLAGVAQSTDNGRSFQHLASVCDDPSVGQRREPGIALLGKGELVAVLRTGTSNTSKMVLTRSSDGGRTWGPPQTLAMAGVCPQLCLLDNGALVMSYGTRDHVHTAASWDGGRTWSDPLALYTGQGTGYTSIQALSADSYRVVYDESTFNTFQPGGNRIVRMVISVSPASTDSK